MALSFRKKGKDGSGPEMPAAFSPHMTFIDKVAGPLNLDDEDASMPAPPPPLHLSSQYGPYGVFVAPVGESAPMLEPGERLGGPPPRRRRGRRALRTVLLLSLMGGGAWLLLERRDDVTAFASLATTALQNLQHGRQLPPTPAREDTKIAEAPPLPDREFAPAPVMHTEAVPPPARPAAEDPPSTPAPLDAEPETSAPPERLPAVTADPGDPLQQKALAAGLHPGLSRTLLDRLTAEDFRNAAHAVKAALSGDKAAAPYVWPPQRAPRRAQFKVRLVTGAPGECRRYVVQIAKDGWETTARPMERCNARQAFKPS